MPTKNDVTGDSIQSKAPSQKYMDNYDAIFGKKSAVDDAADVQSKFDSWTCECKAENTTLEVAKGESCNWCGKYEDGTLD